LDVLPYFCEHRGFETVALDVSSRAIQYQRAHPPGPGWWRFWVCYSDLDHTGELLTRSEAELAELRAAEHIAGGSVDFRVADAFDLSAETGQWDVAITRNLVEHYEAEDRRTLLAGLFACLRPGGTMILETERRALPESEDGELQPYPEVEDVGFVTPYRRVAEWHQDHILGSMEYEEFDRQRSPVMSEAIAEEDEAIRGGRRVAVVYSH
jgi:SAM-dependent methyltransferase